MTTPDHYLSTMFSLDGVRAVVTGGAGVIPKVMAEALVRAGATVSIWGRGVNHPVQEAVQAIAEAADGADRVVGETVDTAVPEAVGEALSRTERAHWVTQSPGQRRGGQHRQDQLRGYRPCHVHEGAGDQPACGVYRADPSVRPALDRRWYRRLHHQHRFHDLLQAAFRCVVVQRRQNSREKPHGGYRPGSSAPTGFA